MSSCLSPHFEFNHNLLLDICDETSLFRFFGNEGKNSNPKKVISVIEELLFFFQAIEEGVSHMWTVSAFQQHMNTIMVCDEDATLELRVRTVKYFKVNPLQRENTAHSLHLFF